MPKVRGLVPATYVRGRAWPFIAAPAIVLILAAYAPTLQGMVATWQRSDTYAHGALIAPVSLWLGWRRRRELALVAMRPNWLALPLIAALGFGWLLASLADAQVLQQYFLVAMVPAAVWAMFGTQCVRALAFPLAYLVLAVPFGDAFIPYLIRFTADFTVAALQLTGIPVYREGNALSLPSGDWSVVEACSGLRYLIASFTLGSLFAHLAYRSLKRRLLFIAAAIAVPIAANGLRAYLIVITGHFTSMQFATGVDHLIYGWLFFGLVMSLLFWAGSWWREGEAAAAAAPAPAARAGGRTGAPSFGSLVSHAAACMLLAVLWPAYAAHLEQAEPSAVDVAIGLPQAVGEWERVPDRLSSWEPRHAGATEQLVHAYRRRSQTVELHVGYYARQRPGSELIQFQNTLVPAARPQWRAVREETRKAGAGGPPFEVRATVLGSSAGQLQVWHWYWLAGETTTNPYMAKIFMAGSRLLGRPEQAAHILIATSHDGGQGQAEASLSDFMSAWGAGPVGAEHAALR